MNLDARHGERTCLLHRLASRLVLVPGRRQMNHRCVLPFTQHRQTTCERKHPPIVIDDAATANGSIWISPLLPT
jgi:hypothetical protein